jgi:cell division protein FtsZ
VVHIKEMGMAFEMLETETSGTVIKVIGVGGAGGNAVEHMIRREVQNVEFIVANTDRQALKKSAAPNLLQLGKTGLGAGAKPEVGRQAAQEMRERIADSLRGAHMVFITAGMGGGTGTGAAPVVAEVAKELGILTVAVVSKPFDFEGPKRMKIAEQGLAELEDKVHSLIVILNSKLEEVLGEDAEMAECFRAADDVLHNACAGIAEIINNNGLVNVDFEDVRTVMSEQGKAMMGTAQASGLDRARIAAEQAVASPLLEGVDLSGARGVLVNITASSSLKMKETREVMNTIRAFAAEDATVIFGTVKDEAMGDDLRVTVVATGLGRSAAKRAAPPLQMVRTGTDNAPVGVAPAAPGLGGDDFSSLERPAIWRTREREHAQARVSALEESVSDRYDIPAFLRKQAD